MTSFSSLIGYINAARETDRRTRKQRIGQGPHPSLLAYDLAGPVCTDICPIREYHADIAAFHIVHQAEERCPKLYKLSHNGMQSFGRLLASWSLLRCRARTFDLAEAHTRQVCVASSSLFSKPSKNAAS